MPPSLCHPKQTGESKPGLGGAALPKQVQNWKIDPCGANSVNFSVTSRGDQRLEDVLSCKMPQMRFQRQH